MPPSVGTVCLYCCIGTAQQCARVLPHEVNRFIFCYNRVQIQISSSVAEDVQSLFYSILIKMCVFLPELSLNMALKLEVRFGISKSPFGQPRRFLRAGVSLKGLSVECSGGGGMGENSRHTFKICSEVVLHQLAHQTFVAKCM